MVQNITTTEERLKVYDMLLKGLVLFVRPTGKKTWFVDYKKPDGKRTNHLIGSAQLFTVAEARELARDFLSDIAKGKDPTEQEVKIKLGDFLKEQYERWALDYRKSGALTLAMIKANFEWLFDTPMEDITISQIDEWRIQKKKRDGVKASSINRMVTSLKAAINWAVKRDILAQNPLAKLEPLPERDSVKKVRYLTADERTRLMDALDQREKDIREGRDSHNDWLDTRGLEKRPCFIEGHFVDHLKPVVVTSLLTGIRRNSLLSLEWGDVNFADRTILVRAATSKSDKEYYVPMSDTAFETLSLWHKQSKKTGRGDLVFPSPKTGKKMGSCDSGWESLLKRAGIENFRWHDMRHDFASQLVMSGVDLNTVRELLGHADLKMTLRYAHLAPENKMQAVKVLDKKHGSHPENKLDAGSPMLVQ
jgi:integrase